MNNNRHAFLDTIAWAEIGPRLLALSDNGYNIMVGSTPDHLLLFHDYSTHPRTLNVALASTAAGRYQLLYRYFVAYQHILKLPDFSPASQDAIALQQLKECDALEAVDAGRFDEAVARCAHIWASFPGNQYKQHPKPLADLRAAYLAAGGLLTPAPAAPANDPGPVTASGAGPTIKENTVPQNSSVITGGVTFTTATLMPVVSWLVSGAPAPVPESVPYLVTAAVVTVSHALYNVFRAKGWLDFSQEKAP
jgi:muramidase (phage lysozyme)